MIPGISDHFQVEPAQRGSRPWRDPRLMGTSGYEDVARELAGCAIESGLYRFHDDRSGPEAAGLIAEAFPEFAVRTCPFGYDWLGRQFALDVERGNDGESLVLMMEPGTGQALEIPFTFSSFHAELFDLREPALAESFFRGWKAANLSALPLSPESCVGYRVPLFLGGRDELDNLEVIDLAVYWSLCGQLRRGALKLPPGTAIREITGGT